MSSEVLKFLRSGAWAKFVLQFLFPPSTELLVETTLQTNGKKGEVGFGRLLLHKSENRFLRRLLPCLVRLGSSPHSGLLLFEYLSTIFKYSFPSKFDSVEITR